MSLLLDRSLQFEVEYTEQLKNEIKEWSQSVKSYVSPINMFLSWLDLNKKTKLSIEDVEEYRDYLLNAHVQYKPRTIVNKLTVVKKLYLQLSRFHPTAYYVERELRDIKSQVQIEHRGALDHRIFTKDELSNFYSNARPRFRSVLSALMISGVRISELFQLNLNEIELNPDLNLYIQVVKSKTGIRQLELTPEVYENVIKSWKRYIDDSGNVFSREYTLKAFNKAVNREIKKYTTKSLSAHATRHTIGTTMVNEGVDYSEIQDVLAHKDISTTIRYYVKRNRSEKRSQIQRKLANV